MSRQEQELRQILLPHIVDKDKRERVIGRILPLISGASSAQNKPQNPYPDKAGLKFSHVYNETEVIIQAIRFINKVKVTKEKNETSLPV